MTESGTTETAAQQPKATVDTMVDRVLRGARALIADITRWTQWRFACKPGTWSCSPQDPAAKRSCPKGAVRRAAWDLQRELRAADVLFEDVERAARHRLDRAARAGWSISAPTARAVNDNKARSRGEIHAAVLALFDAALARQ